MDLEHKEEIKAKLVKCEDVENPELHYKKLRSIGDKLITDTNLDDLTQFLNAIANKKRLILLHILKEKDRCVCELEAVLDESQPSISHHLKILENSGLIKGWKKGKFTHYDLIQNQIEGYMNLLNQELD